MQRKPKPPAKKIASVKKKMAAEKAATKSEEDNETFSDPIIDARPVGDWPGSKIEMVAIDELRPNPKNSRKHSNKQIDQIGRSIDKWGFTSPILAREDGMLIAGEGRWLAAKRKGLDLVPVMFAIGWSDDEIRAYIIADNAIAANSTWDGDILAAEIAELDAADFDLDLLGISDEELQSMRPREERFKGDPDAVPAPAPKTICQKGDVWILGNHKLICGDSTSGDVLERLMEKELANVVWTDPPATVDDLEDEDEDENYTAFLVDAFVGAFSFMRPGSAIYIYHEDSQGLNVRAAFKSAGFKYSECIIWNKISIEKKRRDYQPAHAPILYGWKTGAKHRWLGDRKQRSIVELEGNVFAVNADKTVTVRSGDETIIIAGDNLVAEPIEPTVITVARGKSTKPLAAARPVELVEKMVRNSAKKGDILLDLFAGSGTTAIAAELNGLRGRLVELSPVNCDVIIRRWQEFVGRDAVRTLDEMTFDATAKGKK